MEDRYGCPECGFVCYEEDMGADYYYITDEDGYEEDIWSNWICPKCEHWHFDLDDWTLLPGRELWIDKKNANTLSPVSQEKDAST